VVGRVPNFARTSGHHSFGVTRARLRPDVTLSVALRSGRERATPGEQTALVVGELRDAVADLSSDHGRAELDER
jgi:hypothetical protein